MLKWGIGVAAATLATAFAGGQASAQSYISASAGWNNLDNADTRIENGVSPGTAAVFTINTDENYSGHAAFGYDLGALRVEAEVGMTQNDNVEYNSSTPAAIRRAADGNVTTLSAMANIFYDFDLGGGFTPFVGVGGGFTKADVEFTAPYPTTPNAAAITIIDNDATNIGWQIMAGATIPLTGNMSLTGQYRYYDIGTVDMNDVNGRAAQVDLKGISWDIGLRWGF